MELALAQLLRACSESGFAILAYCFMPDHVHLLVEGTGDASDCRRFIRLAKQYSGYAHSRRFGQVLWQRYSFERVLRDDEPVQALARYIVANPVRAGLATQVREYRFVGSPACGLDALLGSIDVVPRRSAD